MRRVIVSRVLFGAMIGAFCGVVIGIWMYGEKCVLGAIDYDCTGPEELKIALVTVAGFVVGLVISLLASRTRRSTSRNG